MVKVNIVIRTQSLELVGIVIIKTVIKFKSYTPVAILIGFFKCILLLVLVLLASFTLTICIIFNFINCVYF